jgi:hypothetical protein
MLVLVALVGCNADLDEQWELSHDRIIAVRADPPRIPAGGQATIEMLVGFESAPVQQRPPDVASVVAPEGMTNVVAPGEAGTWTITAPSDAELAVVRAQLGMPEGTPVPLQIGVAAAWPTPVMSPDNQHFGAMKTVWLGETAANPELQGVLVNGVEPGLELVVPKQTKVPLYVEADDNKGIVNWLTSCGAMHDFDLHSAYLTVDPEDSQEGQLVLVVRDDRGGVTWQIWPIRAE